MTSAHTPSSRDWHARLYEHPLVWLALLTVAHVVSRVAISPGMKWDESEQILWAQQFAWGYGPQPPLYTWMQWVVCQLLGPSVLALALVKQVLIALSYVLAWLAARTLLEPPGAWRVAGALVLMLPFGWHALRDQTHSVLVTAMGFGAWWAVLRQIRTPKAANFGWLGLFCGLGLLTKYNFALFITALLLAALTVAQARRAVLAPGWWWAPLVGLLIFAPHGYWLLSHWHQATAETLQKMDISAQRTWLQGLASLGLAVLSTLGLWLLAVLLSYRGRLWGSGPGRYPVGATVHAAIDAPVWRSWAWPLLGRYLLIVCLALTGMVLLGGVSHFKQRWVLPLLSIAPLALYVWRPALLAACRTLGVDSENGPQRGQFLPDLPPHSGAMGQEDGKKWAAAAHLQPAIPKSDRLLGIRCAHFEKWEAHMSDSERSIDAQLLAQLQAWQGRTETLHDSITAAPMRGLSATLDRDDQAPLPGTPLAPLWHWLYFLPQVRQSGIGPDGHPRRGGFLPPVPLPRRMWAGGRLQWEADNPLALGDKVHRISRIESVTHKAGRSGDLVFVLVRHEIFNERGLALTEEQDIVYRPAAQPGDPAPAAHAGSAGRALAACAGARPGAAVSLLGADLQWPPHPLRPPVRDGSRVLPRPGRARAAARDAAARLAAPPPAGRARAALRVQGAAPHLRPAPVSRARHPGRRRAQRAPVGQRP